VPGNDHVPCPPAREIAGKRAARRVAPKLLGDRPVPPHTQPEPRLRAHPQNLIELRLVLLLGCEPELSARCRSVAARARVLVRSQPLPVTRAEVAELRPLVIGVPAPHYESAPWDYEVLAEKVGASLLTLDASMSAPIVLEDRLTEALAFATRLRARLRRKRQ
jgi:hypothetical protein